MILSGNILTIPAQCAIESNFSPSEITISLIVETTLSKSAKSTTL